MLLGRIALDWRSRHGNDIQEGNRTRGTNAFLEHVQVEVRRG